MLLQLIYGTLLIIITVIVQALFIGMAVHFLAKAGPWFERPSHSLKLLYTLVGLVLWLVAGLSVSAWLWAGAFLWLDIFNDLESALYFSVVTFTTLGYGDMTLTAQWRILGSLLAVSGLIIVGLNTAFLVEAISRIRSAQLEKV
ncbi:potassium channel family protein [Pseudoalteromonas peptidolytica]|uniref:potassium channel family protein n=1 Tax=Pseudoalteromonas peptidolytica TaxID=61150 RepID=UPI00298D6DB0|nr:potassium channel family protein [Pseudoalteromonas peptidolytica]MDW7550400.1 potassium channel family protein [Pseudoalteromonas peptidolytica]